MSRPSTPDSSSDDEPEDDISQDPICRATEVRDLQKVHQHIEIDDLQQQLMTPMSEYQHELGDYLAFYKSIVSILLVLDLRGALLFVLLIAILLHLAFPSASCLIVVALLFFSSAR